MDSPISPGGVELHVSIAGPEGGPPLVLLHGWPEDHRCWQSVAPLLADRYRLLLPDQRGFGRSGMPEGASAYSMGVLLGDLLGILDHFGVERAGLVGHDVGGALAWSAGMFVPQRFTRAVILSAPHPQHLQHAGIDDPTQVRRAFYAWLLQAGESGEALLAAGRFRWLTDWAFAGSAVPDGLIDEYRVLWSEPGRFHAMGGWYRANYRPDLFNPDRLLRLPPVRLPVRYLQGEDDVAFVPGAARGSGAHVTAEYDEQILPGLGHWLPHDAAALVAGAVDDWMRRDPGSPGADP
jgi:pimeloyl-ACP methyl ester carboxylesterase